MNKFLKILTLFLFFGCRNALNVSSVEVVQIKIYKIKDGKYLLVNNINNKNIIEKVINSINHAVKIKSKMFCFNKAEICYKDSTIYTFCFLENSLKSKGKIYMTSIDLEKYLLPDSLSVASSTVRNVRP